MIIPEGYGQATFKFGGPQLPHGAAVIVGFRNDSPDSPAQIAATLGGEWSDTISGIQSSSSTLVAVAVKFGPNDDGPSAEVPFDKDGEEVTAGLSPNTAYLVSKQTALGGRRHRGRMYLPGVTESRVDGAGNIEPAVFGTFQEAISNFFDGMAANDTPMAILHSSAGAPNLVTAVNLNSVVATQRKRLRR